MLERPEQAINAEFAIEVTFFGIVITERLVHLVKVYASIFVTLSGIFMLSRLVQL